MAWPRLAAGRIVIVVAPADGSRAAMKRSDRAERLTKVIVAGRPGILRPGLMKIVGGNSLFGHVQGFKAGGAHGEDAVNILHFAFDNQIGVIQDSGALAVENVRHNDGVRYAGFVFDTEEQQAFGGARPLAADDAAGDPG